MADELRVVITADASGVGPGVAEATAAVQSSADQIATAQAKATASTKLLTQAQIELGAAAEAGNTQAAAIIAEYAAANSAAQASVEALTAAQVEGTAATVADTAAQAADTAATYSHAEAMGAAKTGMGAMTGSTHMMEMGLVKLASGSSVLGPLLANMVPVAVFAAGAYLLYDLGEALYKAFDMGGEAAREAEQKTEALNESYRTLIDETSLEGDKIDASIAKLEHVPNPNAAKEAIDSAMVEADKMASKLDALIEKEETLLKSQGLSGSGFQRFLLNQPGTRQEEVDLAQHVKHLDEANGLQGQLTEQTSFTATEQARLNQLLKEQAGLNLARNTSDELSIAMTIVGFTDLNAEVDRQKLIVAESQKRATVLQNTIADQKKSADLSYLEATKQIELDEKSGNVSHVVAQQRIADAQQVRKATLEAMGASATAPPPLPPIKEGRDKGGTGRAITEDYAQEAAELKAQGADLGAIVLFWEQVNVDGKHYTELLQAQRDLLRQMGGESEDYEKALKAIHAAEGEGKTPLQAPPSWMSQTETAGLAGQPTAEERSADQDAQANEAVQRQVEARQQLYEQEVRNIEEEERFGSISARNAAAQEEALRKLAVQQEIAMLRKRQEAIAPMGVMGLDEKQLKEYEELQRKMDQIAQRGEQERVRITQQETQKIDQLMEKVSKTIEMDFQRAFNEWATKSQTASQAFSRMLGEMELSVIDFAAKTVLEHALMWAELKIEQALGIETMKTEQAAANLATISKDAKTAAANAYQWASAWGGPPAGAIAAALAFTAVEAFGVFDTGGMMPHMGMAFNTSGSVERVLSPSQTSNFESLVNNGGSRRATLNQTNHFGGGVTKEMLDAHTSQTMNKLRGMLRPEAFA
jgi:hypothetical protein